MNKRNIVLTSLALTLLLFCLPPMILKVPEAVQAVPALPREQTFYFVRGLGTGYTNPTMLNLYAPGAPSRSGTGMQQNIWEYFSYWNYQTGEDVMWLAQRYEYSADFKSLTVYLTQGVKWNDGYAFTADDVVFTYNMLLQNAPRLGGSAAVAADVDSVTKIDNYTVRINLKAANPRFHLNRDTFPAVRVWGGLTIVPKHIWEGKDPLTFSNYPNPVGTGPYKLVSAAQTAAIFERRDDWWATEKYGIRPAPKYVVFETLGTEETLAAALASNDVDAVNIGLLSFGAFLTVQQRNPYVTAWYKAAPYAWNDPCPRLLIIQNAKYPWNDPQVRRAISYLINRTAIASLAYDRTTVPTPYIFPAYGGYQEYFDAIQNLITQYEPTAYNPAKATAIFQSLGWTKGADGVWVTGNGTRVAMLYLVSSQTNTVEQRRVSEVLAQQLRAAGMDVTVKILADAVLTDSLKKGDFDIFYGWQCPGDTDPFFNLNLYNSKYTKPLGEAVGSWEYNGWRFINSTYDAIVNRLMTTSPLLNKTGCLALFRQAMAIYYAELPTIPIVQAPAFVPVNTNQWTGWPTADNPWIMPVPWWAQLTLMINGFNSSKTGGWVGGIRLRTIDYATVYFTKHTPEFRGIDLTWYGPFEADDSERIPADDAEFYIGKGYASYSPPVPTFPELATIAQTVSSMSTDLTSVKTSLAGLSGAVGILEIAVILEAVAIVALALILFRRKT
jgi:peptide/nickel transport system substrate-binding protein